MKKLIIAVWVFTISFGVFGQEYVGRTILLGKVQYDKYYLAGSLPKIGNIYRKLKIIINGGNWHNTNTGENEYFISARDGLKINQEVHGGAYSKYELKVYEIDNQYDFVIHVTATYPYFNIRSWLVDDAGFCPIEILDYNPEGKIDVTEQVDVNEIFVTDHIGNIGIGTATPEYKLDVLGTIRAQELKVDMEGADFVFEDDYQLRPIEEVENFVSKNKHLPGIAPAKEMQENGVNQSEMNQQLLQKIEELTLYLIDQNKKLLSQSNEIQQLKAEIKELKK